MAIGQYSTGHNRLRVPEYWTHSAKDVRANQALSILVWALLWIWYVFKSEFRLIIARTSLIGAYCGFIRFRCRSSNEEASNELMSAFFAGLAFAVEFFGAAIESGLKVERERKNKEEEAVNQRSHAAVRARSSSSSKPYRGFRNRTCHSSNKT
uniref:Uncharacterized protein n=1 Tax=Ditylenchus dipsaci TaxID=166011 RepID=A0A915E5J6_9BILA